MVEKDTCFLCRNEIGSGEGIDYFCFECVDWSFTFRGLVYWFNMVGFVNTVVLLDLFVEKTGRIL